MTSRTILSVLTGLACVLTTMPPASAQLAPSDPVLVALTTGTPAERAAVAKSMAVLGPKGVPALPALIRALQTETDSNAAGELIGALSAIGLGDASEVDELIRFVKATPDADQTYRILFRLVSWAKSGRPEANKAIEPTAALLGSPHPGVRASASLVLGGFGGRAKETLPKLTAQIQVETEAAVKVTIIGAIVGIYDATDPLCGVFEGDNGIIVEAHRDHTPTYHGRITLNGNEYPSTAPVASPATGTFKAPDGSQFPFTLTPTPDGVQLQSGNATYRLKRQAKPTG